MPMDHALPPDAIAVIVAMRTELRHFLERLDLDEPTPDAPGADIVLPADDPNAIYAKLPPPNVPSLAGIWPTWVGTHAGRRVVAVLSGIGPSNAAGATGALFATVRPRAVLNYGCAGAHRRDLAPGDIIIGDRSVNHVAYDLLPDGTERFRGNEAATGPDPMPPSIVDSDPALLALAQEAADGWAPEPWPTAAVAADGTTEVIPKVLTGAIGSADVWTQAHDRLDRLHQTHGTLCEEMEAASIGIVCRRAGVPFLPIKDISNNEYQRVTVLEGGLQDFPHAEVGKRAAALVLRVIERLS